MKKLLAIAIAIGLGTVLGIISFAQDTTGTTKTDKKGTSGGGAGKAGREPFNIKADTTKTGGKKKGGMDTNGTGSKQQKKGGTNTTATTHQG